MKLGDYLRDEKLTVAAFGALVGVGNKQTMSRYVRGDRFPPADTLLRIREVTAGRVTADDFVDQHTQPASA